MKKNSQTSWVLNKLMGGHTLTSMSAWKGRGITRLADIIFRLRKKGWNIKTDKARSLDGAYYAKYHIVFLSSRRKVN